MQHLQNYPNFLTFRRASLPYRSRLGGEASSSTKRAEVGEAGLIMAGEGPPRPEGEEPMKEVHSVLRSTDCWMGQKDGIKFMS